MSNHMISIDTNILARHILEDDAEQLLRVQTLITNHHCFVPITVTLELNWVLASCGLSKPKIIQSILTLMQTQNLIVEHQRSLTQAMQWAIKGMDIADAIHLSLAQHHGHLPFATFDNRMRRVADANDIPDCIMP